MEKWFDELKLSSRPILEIGIAFYIREIMQNNCVLNRWDVHEIFGDRHLEAIDALRRAGILKVETTATRFIFRIVAPGDRHREQAKKRSDKRRKEKKDAKENG